MKLMKKSFLAIVSVAAFSGLGSAYAQVETEGVRDIFEHMYVEPGQFTVNSDADMEVVDFDQPRDVRFCLDVSEDRTPLHIKYEKNQGVASRQLHDRGSQGNRHLRRRRSGSRLEPDRHL